MVILIAEDNELILRTVQYKLIKAGHEVITTTNGKDAIEKLNTMDLDLIITDIMMPFASGIEVLSSIKKLEKKIPVIVLSNMGQEEVVIEAFDLGASDFMVKPFSPEELLLRVKRLTSNNISARAIPDHL
ncbi:response regulator [Sphingobacterium paramultivorum]|uniref:Response regulator n=1 Tax=Sphingobacterium paramultivorum TaxID=2886510 RepID=A0A7G5E500_9SPHI|nr:MULTISPECIES: response regulator [Sphingobacterium]MCS4165604.1 two-component system response regulator VicR [Sphingobacterium sp. BIGb0116]QMV69075.1 response regulator [Sphingobacterium paramultivorum]QRY57575.1 response regulator [Sphingobacterium siyangense]WSO12856.1 response regulator [Sphingobacterium paramultivorum]